MLDYPNENSYMDKKISSWQFTISLWLISTYIPSVGDKTLLSQDLIRDHSSFSVHYFSTNKGPVGREPWLAGTARGGPG